MTRAPVQFVQGHHAVRRLMQELNARKITVDELSYRSGVAKSTLYNWYHCGHLPNIVNLEACLNAVGLELTVVPK